MTIGDSPDDRDAPRVPFGAGTRAIVKAIAEAIGADDGPDRTVVPLRPEKVDWLADELEIWSASGSPSLRYGLRTLFWIVDFLPPLVVGRLSRASRLPLAERIAYLEAVENARFGLLATAFIGLKIPLAMMLFEEGEELRETGFDRATVSTPRKLPVLRAGEARS